MLVHYPFLSSAELQDILSTSRPSSLPYSFLILTFTTFSTLLLFLAKEKLLEKAQL